MLPVMIGCSIIFIYSVILQTHGHGNMIYPVPWDNQEGNGQIYGPRPTAEFYQDPYKFRGISLPLPDNMCPNALCHPNKPIWMKSASFEDCGIETSGNHCSGCSIQSCRVDWYTNHTFIPGPATLPDDMYQYLDCLTGEKTTSAGNCIHHSIEELSTWRHPWSSPGTAPVFGEGCGSHGGNPYGCGCEQNRLDNMAEICSGKDDRPYGSCCGPTRYRCGGFTGGMSAIDHATNGLFDNGATTKWKRGSNVEIVRRGTQHGGGYAYRLCHIPPAGISEVTEQCFQNGHLNFAGTYNWFANLVAGHKWHREIAVRINDTFGHPWTKIMKLPDDDADDWALKDLIHVPSHLKEGHYILSSRWDAQSTPQVFNSCAKIELV